MTGEQAWVGPTCLPLPSPHPRHQGPSVPSATLLGHLSPATKGVCYYYHHWIFDIQSPLTKITTLTWYCRVLHPCQVPPHCLWLPFTQRAGPLG